MGVVVAAAVVRRGRVLAARRTWPAEVAGRWELPGGRVEAGEQPGEALVREISEELGCAVAVRHWLEGSQPIPGGRDELRVAVVDLLAGDPEPREHDELRWLDAGRLDDLDWLEPDRPFLADVRLLLADDARPARGPGSGDGSGDGSGERGGSL